MIPITQLRRVAQARLKDAQGLLVAGRYDGGIYLCGYAVEIALKARICKTLKWPQFPETSREFERYRSFQTHDLEVLLNLSGQEPKVKKTFVAEWSVVAKWTPEVRYKPAGVATKSDLESMISSAKTLIQKL